MELAIQHNQRGWRERKGTYLGGGWGAVDDLTELLSGGARQDFRVKTSCSFSPQHIKLQNQIAQRKKILVVAVLPGRN